MSDEKLIHVKMDYVDALESKKSLLNLEKELLELNEVAFNFSSLRIQELRAKVKFCQGIKNLSNSLMILKKNLPEGKVPRMMKEAKVASGEKSERIVKKTRDTRDIELQLRDIQEKLSSMQR